MSDLISRARQLRNSPNVTEYFPHGWLRSVGFEFATLVALTIGLPLSKGRVRKEGDLIVLTGLPKWAFKRGGTTVGRVYLTRDNDGDAVLRHEAIHVEQWRKYGFWMPVLYTLAGPDPLKNRYEIEAGLEDGGYVPRRAARKPRARATATTTAPEATTEGTTGGTDESAV